MDVFYDKVDSREKQCIDLLKKWVSIPSVFVDPNLSKHCFEINQNVKIQLEKIGFEVELCENPCNKIGDKMYPPIMLATLFKNSTFKTVCFYGHLDVQPADISDGWSHDPFEMTEREGKLYGRGTTDDKGPLLAMILACQFLKDLNMIPSINIKFCIETTEESGSVGLSEVIAEKTAFFQDIEFLCISDNFWLGDSVPCITYGLRGLTYFHVEVEGPSMDLHSGIYGGIVCEPMSECIKLLSTLVDVNGKILIPGIYDEVAHYFESEKNDYASLNFDTEKLKKSVGVSDLIHETKEQVLAHRWRIPALSIHGIEGAYYGKGEKTVIPSKVVGKFSIRTVPNMKKDRTEQLVIDYLQNESNKLSTSNRVCIKCVIKNEGWVLSKKSKHFEAASKAIFDVYKKYPDFTREGSTVPVAQIFKSSLHADIILLPIGKFDDSPHSQFEKIDSENYINGIKLFGAYVCELAENQS